MTARCMSFMSIGRLNEYFYEKVSGRGLCFDMG